MGLDGGFFVGGCQLTTIQCTHPEQLVRRRIRFGRINTLNAVALTDSMSPSASLAESGSWATRPASAPGPPLRTDGAKMSTNVWVS
jgi:hypothetical protein